MLEDFSDFFVKVFVLTNPDGFYIFKVELINKKMHSTEEETARKAVFAVAVAVLLFAVASHWMQRHGGLYDGNITEIFSCAAYQREIASGD